MRPMRLGGWSWVAAVTLIACGGTTQPSVNETATEPEAASEPEAAPEPEAEAAEAEEAEPAEPEEAEAAEPEEAEAAEPEQAPAPAPEPVTATTADELHEVMLAASTDVVTFRRLVDTQWGVGVYNRDEDLARQYCDPDDLATGPGLGFVMSGEDPWRCNRDLSRCTSQSDGHGYAFHFRSGSGDAIYLNAIVHYEPRVPSRDNAAVRAFVRSGDGVCDLYRALQEPASEPPDRLSVFVSKQTGLVPEALSEHDCGPDAAAAYAERIAPLVRGGQPDGCYRNPTRCVFASRDEERTVYGGEDGPVAIAITRPNMFPNLARQQDHDLQAFLREVRRHDCED